MAGNPAGKRQLGRRRYRWENNIQVGHIEMEWEDVGSINLLKPAGHVMHQQFNIQQFYLLPTLYLCVLYLSENKQRLVPLTA